jgi:Uma2 family endonuclease
MALPAQFAATLLDKDWYTEDEYFAWDERSQERWEFVPDGPLDTLGRRTGTIRAMSGGTADHSGIAANLISALAVGLRDAGRHTCRVFNSDLKVSAADGRKTFPDVSVICGPLKYHRLRQDTIANPILIAEVLSPSTAQFDRGEKWASYQTIPSLKHYLLLATDKARVELYTRQEQGWLLETYEGLGSHVSLSALNITLALADLYAQVEFSNDYHSAIDGFQEK